MTSFCNFFFYLLNRILYFLFPFGFLKHEHSFFFYFETEVCAPPPERAPPFSFHRKSPAWPVGTASSKGQNGSGCCFYPVVIG